MADAPAWRDQERTQRSSALAKFADQLNTSIDAVIQHSGSLLSAAQRREDCSFSEEIIPDLQKIQDAAMQMSSLVAKIFTERLNSEDDDLDLSSISSTIRHDLRTPINAMIGYSEMMLEDAEETDIGEMFSESLQVILNSGRRLLNLVNELIYMTQSENGGTSAEGKAKDALPPPNLMEEVVRSIHHQAEEEEKEDLQLQESSLLIIDDRESNRDLLSRQLRRYGFKVYTAKDGQEGLDMLKQQEYDLILLDVLMPGLNGYQVLAILKADESLQHIPVIMISALDEIDSVVRCIEMGAQDYLQKPFNPVILKAKITASLERKRLRDRERAFLERLQLEQEKSEKLLLNILPPPIAARLKQGARTIADSFPEATILFADIVGFTQLCANSSASALVEQLNDIFLAFDILAELYGVEKIKTIGDAYMLVGGLPTPRPDHAEAVADMAIDMFDAIRRLNVQNASDFRIRVGIHSGPVVAGIIGKHKFNYDLWGDSVNIASRMEALSEPGQIQVSESSYLLLKDRFNFAERGEIDVKGKGKMKTYFLLGRKDDER